MNQIQMVNRRIGTALLLSLAAMLLSQYWLLSHARLFTFIPPAWYSWFLLFISTYIIGYPLLFFILRSLPSAAAEASVKSGGGLYLAAAVSLAAGTYFARAAITFYDAEQPAPPDTAAAVLPLLLFGCLLSPWIEEYVFRKLLLDRLLHLGRPHALLFAVLAFSLYHLNLSQFVSSLLPGWLFCLAYLRNRKLRCPVLLHSLFNLCTTLLLPHLKAALPYLPHKRLLYAVTAIVCLGAGVFLAGSFSLRLLPSSKSSAGENSKSFSLPSPKSGFSPFLTLPFLAYVILALCLLVR